MVFVPFDPVDFFDFDSVCLTGSSGVAEVMTCVDLPLSCSIFHTRYGGVILLMNRHIPHLESHSNSSLHSCANLSIFGSFHCGVNPRIFSSEDITGDV